MRISHGMEFECVQDMVGLCVFLVPDVGVSQLRVERLLGWEVFVIHLLPAIHILVRVHPLSYEESELLHLFDVELLTVFETIEPRLHQIFGVGGKSRAKELKAVFEDQLFAQGECEIFIHPLANHPDLDPFEVLEGHCDEVGVIPPEVMENRDFAGAAKAEVAPIMCSASRLPREMVVIQELVCAVGVEGLVPYVAEGLLVVGEGEPVFPLQALVVIF